MKKGQLATIVLRNSFSAFARHAFTTLHGGKKPSTDPYIEVLCAFLQDIVTSEGARRIVNMPPRHSDRPGSD